MGKFFGVGVGPGDPELITLKAMRLMKEADVIAVPGKVPQEAVAYKIAKGAYPKIAEKELLPVFMPMTKDESALLKSHDEAAAKIESCLRNNKNVVFLTLGDPTVYSTYIYIHNKILKAGYEAEIISGIPSFCAAAARLNMSLAEKDEVLHIVPASYSIDNIDDILKLPGNKVLMKSGKKMSEVKKAIKRSGLDASMVENCGMENEKVYRSEEEIPCTSGYYSLIILKDKKENNMEKYSCTSGLCVGCCYEPCDYVYDPKEGDEDHGIKKGTSFKDLPDDWVCPECGSGKEAFVPYKK